MGDEQGQLPLDMEANTVPWKDQPEGWRMAAIGRAFLETIARPDTEELLVKHTTVEEAVEWTLDLMADANSDTLAAAKQRLHETIVDEGMRCPCCSQWAQMYRRHLNRSMVKLLVWLFKAEIEDPRFHETGEFPMIQKRRGGGDFAKLRYWGLIKEMVNVDDERRTSGLWRITTKGMQFVRGELTVPKYVQLYNGEAYGFAEEHVAISNLTEKGFDYRELMAGVIS